MRYSVVFCPKIVNLSGDSIILDTTNQDQIVNWYNVQSEYRSNIDGFNIVEVKRMDNCIIIDLVKNENLGTLSVNEIEDLINPDAGHNFSLSFYGIEYHISGELVSIMKN